LCVFLCKRCQVPNDGRSESRKEGSCYTVGVEVCQMIKKMQSREENRLCFKSVWLVKCNVALTETEAIMCLDLTQDGQGDCCHSYCQHGKLLQC
jgi:hypothetical protein